MKFLLDTNVVSEWVKPRPDPGVIRWLAEADEDRVFLSVISLAELRFGVERMPAGARRLRLEEWLRDELPLRFESRILSLTADIAQSWGNLMARSQAAGHTMGVMDGFLAATADVHELTLVTRNEKDFSVLGAEAVLNPWTA
jgi:hypothetical protein